MVSLIKYPIQRVINWYHGNFCTRKCFNKEDRIIECHLKFKGFIKDHKDLRITHKDFKDMIDKDKIQICILKKEFRQKTISWSQFEKLLEEESFNADNLD